MMPCQMMLFAINAEHLSVRDTAMQKERIREMHDQDVNPLSVHTSRISTVHRTHHASGHAGRQVGGDDIRDGADGSQDATQQPRHQSVPLPCDEMQFFHGHGDLNPRIASLWCRLSSVAVSGSMLLAKQTAACLPAQELLGHCLHRHVSSSARSCRCSAVARWRVGHDPSYLRHSS